MDNPVTIFEGRASDTDFTIGTCKTDGQNRGFISIAGPKVMGSTKDGSDPAIMFDDLTEGDIESMAKAFNAASRLRTGYSTVVNGNRDDNFALIELKTGTVDKPLTMDAIQSRPDGAKLHTSAIEFTQQECAQLTSALSDAGKHLRMLDVATQAHAMADKADAALASFVAARAGTASQNDVRDTYFDDASAKASRNYSHLNDIEL